MRPTILFAALAASALLGPPQVLAQAPLPAPSGWKAAPRANGLRVYSPPDLKAGEIYSVAVYDSAPLEGATLEEWMRKFGGPVAKTPGKLSAPLTIKVTDGRIVSGTGVYVGPNNSALGVLFIGVTVDGARNVHVMRTLFSSAEVLKRYEEPSQVLGTAMIARAKTEAGDEILFVPAKVKEMMKPGGEIKPGVYAGNQYRGGKLAHRLRVYLYPNGEVRIVDHNDGDFADRWGDVTGVGEYQYNRNSGQIWISDRFDLSNDSDDPEEEFCFYGLDSAGKPIIYSEQQIFNIVTTLRYVGPPTKRIAPAQMKAAAAAAEAEKNRYKFVTPPGKGVQPAQIAAVLHQYDVQVYSAGMGGVGTNVTDEAYLLLKDGTVRTGLPVPPDQMDARRSKQKEPEKWGRWRLKGKNYQVSWDGGPYQPIKADKTFPAVAGQRLAGRYGTASSSASMMHSSYSFWGVTFDKSGRFSKDQRGGSSNGAFAQSMGQPAINSGYDDSGSFTGVTGDGFALGSSRKNNPNGDREGSYTIIGYTLTLRYDNGSVTRLPFFTNRDKSALWFEGSLLTKDDKK